MKQQLIVLLVMLCASFDTYAQDLNYSTTKATEGIIAPAAGKSVVYFVGWKGGGMLPSYECFSSDQYIGYVKQKKYIRYECEPGEHLFWVSSENKEFLTAKLLPDHIYLVKVAFTMGGIRAHPGFRVDLSDGDVKGLVKIIEKKEALSFSKEHIKKTNEDMQGFIERNLRRYEASTKDIYHFKHLEATDYYQ